MSRKPCQNVSVRRTIDRHNDPCSERRGQIRTDSIDGQPRSVEIEVRTVNPCYQHNIWYDDAQQSVCPSAALPEVLEQVSENQKVGDLEQISTLAKICR